MNEITAIDYMLKQLADQRERIVANVLSGRNTLEEYHRLCGVLQGLGFAQELITTTVKKVAEEDDDG
jgi:hypothetical protein